MTTHIATSSNTLITACEYTNQSRPPSTSRIIDRIYLPGDGSQSRDFVHVSDVARAFALAAQTPAANGLSVNVGSGTALSVSALADMVGGERVAAAARVNDLRATLASTCRAKEVLGFETTRDFRDALRCVLHTGPHTTALARWTPILKDFARRISPPTPRFQSPPSTPFNSN